MILYRSFRSSICSFEVAILNSTILDVKNYSEIYFSFFKFFKNFFPKIFFIFAAKNFRFFIFWARRSLLFKFFGIFVFRIFNFFSYFIFLFLFFLSYFIFFIRDNYDHGSSVETEIS